jgi:poly-gamma-glutamate synthesis protein (capsule biosynthesis protein)
MGIEFRGNSFISYGLGNFLFDQMQTMSHRRGLMARHHFYRGRHVQTELIPYVIHDWCQPRPARGREAREIMEEVFRLSEGPVFK